jgi:hypothetical protein
MNIARFFSKRNLFESLAIALSMTVLLFSAYVMLIGYQIGLLGFQFLIDIGLIYVPFLLMILSVITKVSEESVRQLQMMFSCYIGVILSLCFLAPK